MTYRSPARTAPDRGERPLGIAVYGCEPDEAELFHELAPRFGVAATTTRDAVSASTLVPASGIRCVSVGHKSKVTGWDLRALKGAGVDHLSSRSIGLDHIDLAAARHLGITVENVVYASDGVADFTLMLILMVIRTAPEILTAAARNDFRLGPVRGRDLRDMTVGVVGVGHIGQAVVERLRGFGCRVLACGTARAAEPDFISLDELLLDSDIVTLHVPLNADTHHLIGRRQIETMRQGAFLINTGRGALVDTAALLAALEHGALGGAALDVIEGEEGHFYVDRTTTPVDHPFLLRLQQLPNVIVTPHTAHHTRRNLHETVAGTLTRCVDFERNRTHEEAEGGDLVRGLLGGA